MLPKSTKKSIKEAVQKLTNAKSAPPKPKHLQHASLMPFEDRTVHFFLIDSVKRLDSSTNGDIYESLSFRLETSNWVVVVKTLLVFHHLFRIELPPFNPDEEKQSLLQRMLPRTQSPFNMAKFKQSAAVADYHTIIATKYATYLAEDCRVYSHIRTRFTENKTILKDASVDKMLEYLQLLQSQLNALLNLKVSMNMVDKDALLTAVCQQLANDSQILYPMLSDAMFFLIDHCFEMNPSQIEKLLRYADLFVKETDSMIRFIEMCRRNYDLALPDVSPVDPSLITKLTKHNAKLQKQSEPAQPSTRVDPVVPKQVESPSWFFTNDPAPPPVSIESAVLSQSPLPLTSYPESRVGGYEMRFSSQQMSSIAPQYTQVQIQQKQAEVANMHAQIVNATQQLTNTREQIARGQSLAALTPLQREQLTALIEREKAMSKYFEAMQQQYTAASTQLQHMQKAGTSWNPCEASSSTPTLVPSRSSSSSLDLTSIAKISETELKLLQKIGRGGFGDVFKASWHGTEVAVKKLGSDVNTKELLNEINIMKNVRHTHLVSLFGVVETRDEIWLVMELLTKGTLAGFLQNKDQVIDWDTARKMALDIAKGMNCLHHQKPSPIIHRDLKSLNVLLDEHYVVKVADFGLGRPMTASAAASTIAGTPLYMAPEIILGQPYGLKSDVFSYGIVLWELCARVFPYQDLNQLLVVNAIARGARPAIPATTPPSWAALCQACWDSDPSQRPTFDDIVSLLESMVLPSKQLIQISSNSKTVNSGAPTFIPASSIISPISTVKLSVMGAGMSPETPASASNTKTIAEWLQSLDEDLVEHTAAFEKRGFKKVPTRAFLALKEADLIPVLGTDNQFAMMTILQGIEDLKLQS